MKEAKKRVTELDTSLTKLGKQIKEIDMRLKKGGLDQDAFLAQEEKLNSLLDEQKKLKKEKDAKKALNEKLATDKVNAKKAQEQGKKDEEARIYREEGEQIDADLEKERLALDGLHE